MLASKMLLGLALFGTPCVQQLWALDGFGTCIHRFRLPYDILKR